MITEGWLVEAKAWKLKGVVVKRTARCDVLEDQKVLLY